MTDEDALIARLNRWSKITWSYEWEGDLPLNTSPVFDMQEAADRIAALTADNAGYEMALRAASNDACRLQDMTNGLRIEVTKAEAERDALYRFARLNGLAAIDIQNAIDAALREPSAKPTADQTPALPARAPD